jgi:hypothetical protein
VILVLGPNVHSVQASALTMYLQLSASHIAHILHSYLRLTKIYFRLLLHLSPSASTVEGSRVPTKCCALWLSIISRASFSFCYRHKIILIATPIIVLHVLIIKTKRDRIMEEILNTRIMNHTIANYSLTSRLIYAPNH